MVNTKLTARPPGTPACMFDTHAGFFIASRGSLLLIFHKVYANIVIVKHHYDNY